MAGRLPQHSGRARPAAWGSPAGPAPAAAPVASRRAWEEDAVHAFLTSPWCCKSDRGCASARR